MVVGIAGAPGSGKSTLASAISKRVNEKIISLDNPQKSPSPSYFTTAIAIPMDGFHYYKYELDQFPDVKKAYERRGAPWTFNASSFVSRMRQLKADAEVRFPSFEHALGDPKEDDILLEKCHRIVFVEGNYLLLDQNPWNCLKDERIFDESWFLDVSLDDAMARVLRRQLRMGTPEDIAEYRIRTNDRPNGELINESKKRADVLIQTPFDTAL
nr:putative uridine kinase C227.14 [Polytomella parva]